MSVYVVAQVEISDRAEYDHYVAGFRKMFGGYHGEVLAVEEAPVILEGLWPGTRTALLRFESAEEARRWYDSPEYQAAAKHRHRGAKTNLVMIRGLK